jgi:LEA14-like dessication related protein
MINAKIIRYPLSIISCVFLFSCTIFKTPEFESFDKVTFKNTSKGMALHFGANIRNPNFYRVALKKGQLSVSLNNTKVGDVIVSDNMVLKAKKTELKEFELEAGLGSLLFALPMLNNKSVLRVEGELKGKVFIFSKTYKINWESQMK